MENHRIKTFLTMFDGRNNTKIVSTVENVKQTTE